MLTLRRILLAGGLLGLGLLPSRAAAQLPVTNPRTLPDEWPLYGIGDPYILKYRGQYYLYCSTRDDQTGIKVWRSWDLATWTYQGLCATAALTKGAYAPEVAYLNGTFYLNTSPAGRGHCLLTSASPTGPFEPATGNLGRSIDGNVFRDDDGQLYFTHAGQGGILGCTMSSPLTLDGPDQPTGAYLNGWTEGSTLFKREGLYYLTYTGNHVISPGYRVAYATSARPLGPYAPAANGPLLLCSEGSFHGLGHSGSVQGPDLDTWFIAYHNKTGNAGFGPIRQLNIDPMAFNGSKLVVLGPTNWAQAAPALPAFFDRFDRAVLGANWQNVGGGTWAVVGQDYLAQTQTPAGQWLKQVSTTPAAADYTAEFNVQEVERGTSAARYGATFSYQDEDNCGLALLSSHDNTLTTDLRVAGASVGAQAVALPAGWNHQQWHALRVEKQGGTFQVYVDGMLRATRPAAGLGAGRVGVVCYEDQVNFGYLAFSNYVGGSAAFGLAKPVPGTVEAAHYNPGGEGVGYHDLTPGNAGGYRPDDVDLAASAEGGYAVVDVQAGEWLHYDLNVQAAGPYYLGLRYAAAAGGQVRVRCDGAALTGAVALPATGSAATWRTLPLPALSLPAGRHTLRLEAVAGPWSCYSLQFTTAAPPVATADNFDYGYAPGWNYSDGSWQISGGRATLSGFGKRAIGAVGWADYAVAADVRCPTTGNAGLLLRVRNPANGGADDNPQLGTDFLQGYYVGLSAAGIELGRHNYNWTSLATGGPALTPGQTYHLRVEARGATLRVYLGSSSTPVITFADPQPLLSGKAGLRVFSGSAAFDNFQVTPLANSPAATAPPAASALQLFPNPAGHRVSVRWAALGRAPATLTLRTATGRLVRRQSFAAGQRLDVSQLPGGAYVLTLRAGADSATTRLVVAH